MRRQFKLFFSMEHTAKFRVYQNPAVAEALRQRTVRPSPFVFISVLGLFLASTASFLSLLLRRDALGAFLYSLGLAGLGSIVVRAGLWIGGAIFLVTVLAVCKVVYLMSAGQMVSSSRGIYQGSSLSLTEHQQTLLGMQPVGPKIQRFDKEAESRGPDGVAALRQRPPRTRLPVARSTSPTSVMVPLHPSPAAKGPRNIGVNAGSPWGGVYSGSVTSTGQVPSLSPVGGLTPGSQYRTQVSSYPAASYTSPAQAQRSPVETVVSPWGKDHITHTKDEVNNEGKLEEFLAEVQNKMVESSGRSVGVSGQGYLTPPPTIQGAGAFPSPSGSFPTVSSSSTPRSGPKRPIRMSPSTHKTVTSPKKGQFEFPLPMSIEQVTETLQRLGVAAYLEQWRDGLRQWFSSVLLDPLIQKLDSSHLQVMNAAAKLGICITVSQIGSSNQNGIRVFPSEGASREWLSTFAQDDDVTLLQLRGALLQALAPARPPSLFGLQQQPSNAVNPAVRECLDAVTEHQRLMALMEGEWAKGLLPQGGWKAEYVVQRLRVLAEGTCVKRYDFMSHGEAYEKSSKRLVQDLPTDSHLLLYLFCALLEHPQWMLHVDPTTHPSTQSGSNPLYVASMPHKEVFPEKYVAVLPHPPPVLHMGACVLAVSKHSPPVFALYWDKKLQFSLQGRTALWDSILLLCYRVKVAHAGVIRGINLGSSAFNLHSLLEPQTQNDPGR